MNLRDSDTKIGRRQKANVQNSLLKYFQRTMPDIAIGQDNLAQVKEKLSEVRSLRLYADSVGSNTNALDEILSAVSAYLNVEYEDKEFS